MEADAEDGHKGSCSGQSVPVKHCGLDNRNAAGEKIQQPKQGGQNGADNAGDRALLYFYKLNGSNGVRPVLNRGRALVCFCGRVKDLFFFAAMDAVGDGEYRQNSKQDKNRRIAHGLPPVNLYLNSNDGFPTYGMNTAAPYEILM